MKKLTSMEKAEIHKQLEEAEKAKFKPYEDRIAELEKENAELKAQLENDRDLPAIAYMQGAEKQIRIDAEQIRALQKQNGELTDRVKELEAQIEKMKCCGNCSHYKLDNSGLYPIYVCELTYPNRCKNYDKWEIKENA